MASQNGRCAGGDARRRMWNDAEPPPGVRRRDARMRAIPHQRRPDPGRRVLVLSQSSSRRRSRAARGSGDDREAAPPVVRGRQRTGGGAVELRPGVRPHPVGGGARARLHPPGPSPGQPDAPPDSSGDDEQNPRRTGGAAPMERPDCLRLSHGQRRPRRQQHVQ